MTKGSLVLAGVFDGRVRGNSRTGISLAVGPEGLHAFAFWLSAYLALSRITNDLLEHELSYLLWDQERGRKTAKYPSLQGVHSMSWGW
jgi:hypothetical protein